MCIPPPTTTDDKGEVVRHLMGKIKTYQRMDEPSLRGQ